MIALGGLLYVAICKNIWLPGPAGPWPAVRIRLLAARALTTTDAWQVPDIGYSLARTISARPRTSVKSIAGTRPFIYYAFDQSFLDYFGSNGVWAVEQAIAVLNGLTNFSKYSANLTEVPMETRRINYRAQALHLFDLKSVALYLTAGGTRA